MTGKMVAGIVTAGVQLPPASQAAARFTIQIVPLPARLERLRSDEAMMAMVRISTAIGTALLARTEMANRHLSHGRHIWACANTLLQQHGDKAWFQAAQRADHLLGQGDLEGHRTFMAILKRIEQLEALQPEGAVQ